MGRKPSGSVSSERYYPCCKQRKFSAFWKRCPANKEKRDIWSQEVGIEIKASHTLCSEHFESIKDDHPQKRLDGKQWKINKETERSKRSEKRNVDQLEWKLNFIHSEEYQSNQKIKKQQRFNEKLSKKLEREKKRSQLSGKETSKLATSNLFLKAMNKKNIQRDQITENAN